MGGELRSFHTFIRLSHNLAAEKPNHDKNWGKRWGCEVALQVLQKIEKKTSPGGTSGVQVRQKQKNLCWFKVLSWIFPKEGGEELHPPHLGAGTVWLGIPTKQSPGVVSAAAG